ncbi:hypothetical protein DGG96_07420 [Legionella qingyii]|uniref:Uncharacterized protein n=1 Tax=Legionella qingyii TaxID=2184757 RepID=A0A317U640_9GAMM|nr:hypothetical protein DGG96_07420 [Legionella qingyii]
MVSTIGQILEGNVLSHKEVNVPIQILKVVTSHVVNELPTIHNDVTVDVQVSVLDYKLRLIVGKVPVITTDFIKMVPVLLVSNFVLGSVGKRKTDVVIFRRRRLSAVGRDI